LVKPSVACSLRRVLVPGALAWALLATGCASPTEATADAEVWAEAGPDLSDVALAESDADVAGEEAATWDYGVPLDPASPWPKFRRDAAQTGATPLTLTDDGAAPWVFRTGKGIFSSPVIGADGTVFVGSADRVFYALNPDGTLKWSFETGEIIDSAALLDDRGRLYVGSGDGFLYALSQADGKELWRFQADDPSVNHAFIRWFEGNVAIAPDGTLVLGNDNWFIYGVDRDTGEMRWRFKVPDQTWSLPAVDLASGDLFVGNNNLLLPAQLGNVFALDSQGRPRWRAGTLGTNAASPLLTPGGLVVLGGFDGYVHAFAAADGQERWSFGARDHVYASPALHQDGSVIQAGADGTVYSLDASTGAVRWAYDWGNPLRSSPAVDGAGNIYLGTGDGRLLVLNSDGTLRWALKLISEDRDDVNASPALGPHRIVVAGESGEVFGVPFDFCLRPAEAANPGCLRGAGEPLPDDGAFVLFTTRYGSTLPEAPAAVVAHEPLAFSLMVRQGGDSLLALIDTPTLQVEATPPVPLTVEVSAARQFFTVHPDAPLQAGDDGLVRLHVSGRYLLDPEREGLAFKGGTDGGSFDRTFTFALEPGRAGPIPLPVPAAPGDAAGQWELSRLAVPLPTILPSYNQIGFDSHHILIGLVEGTAEQAVAWGLEVQPGAGGALAAIPDTPAIFNFVTRYDQGRLTLENTHGFTLGIQGTTIGFQLFRLAASLDAGGSAGQGATLTATTRCGDVPLYGVFMRKMGLCHPETDLMVTFGAALLEPYQGGVQQAPTGVGTVTFQAAADRVQATLEGSALKAGEHTLGLLLVDAGTGAPVSLDYGHSLARAANPDGTAASVTLSFKREEVPDSVRAYLMVDTYPAARQTLDLPYDPVDCEYAIKVINRAMKDLAADLPRFAARDLTLYLSVNASHVGDADFAALLEQALALGVRVKLWPLLSPEEGAWCNEDNLEPFWANVFSILDYVASVPNNVRTVVINSELGSPKIDLIQKYFSESNWDGLIEVIKGNYDAARFLQSQARQQEMVDELHARGFEAQITTYPYLLDDLLDGDPDIQDAANVVLEGVAWDRLAFTPYSAAYTADFGNPYGPYFVYSYAKLARERFGDKADIALGLVAPGDPHSYTSVEQLAADVAAAKAAGVGRIDVFDLNGMLSGDLFDQWADALLAAPAVPPEEASTVQFHKQFKAADVLLDSLHAPVTGTP